MRLLLASAVTGYFSWSYRYKREFIDVYTQEELFYLLVALAAYLFLEALVQIDSKKSSTDDKLDSIAAQLKALHAEKEATIEVAQTEDPSASNESDSQKVIDSLKAEKEVLEKKLELQKKHTAKAVNTDIGARQAVAMLSLFQSKGRFIDFMMQDITKYDDARVGKVARFVHEGCKSVIDTHFTIEPLHKNAEGEKLTIEEGYKAQQLRLTGSVGDSPPYRGTLVHRGWKSTKVSLPRPVDTIGKELHESDFFVVTPAEVEVK